MRVKIKLLFVVNDAGFFLSHRLPLAEAAQKDGYEIHVATANGLMADRIRERGYCHHVIPFTRSGQNPITEFITFLSILNLYRKLRPDLVHLVTIKPAIYGGIAARIIPVSGVVIAITGLGFVFTEKIRWSARAIRRLAISMYRFATGHHNQCVIFQNRTDMNLFIEQVGLCPNKARLIRGSGVNLLDFSVLSESSEPLIVVMASRLLKEKGVYEFIDAARMIKARGIKATVISHARPTILRLWMRIAGD